MSGKDWEEWAEHLREAHREPIDPAHYAAVRARVLAELGRRRQPMWAWGLAAATALAAVMLFPRPVPVPVGQASRPALPAEASTRSTEPARMVLGPATPPVRHRRHLLARAKQEGRPGGPPHLEPVTIKLLTDDPNVVIYWIADEKG